MLLFCFFFKQKTAYEMRISDWSSDVCSSDLSSANCAPRSPMKRPPKPAMSAPISGRKTIAAYIRPSALHHVDVGDRDRAAVAEVDDQDGETDRGLGRRDRQDEHREHLPDEVAEMRRERDQIDVNSQKTQLDRHQNDDDVLPFEEDDEDAEREQDRRHGQIMREADRHHTPPRVGTLTSSLVSAFRRASCAEMLCRRTPSRSRRVSTMAPIMATSSTIPAAWNR